MRNKQILHNPVVLAGKVVLEFFNNDDSNWKARTMQALLKSIRKEFNISCVTIEEGYLENPERGILVYSLVAQTKDQAGEANDKFLAFLDKNALGRISSNESEYNEYS